MRLIRFALFFLLISNAFAAEKQSIESKIIEKITKTDPICSNCKFIIQKKKYALIANHEVYDVTTFDILPPPAWHVAVRNGKDLFFLDRRKVEEWNDVMTHEKIKLNDDAKVIDYAKFFLATTMNQSEYIDKLLKGEIDRIEAKEKKKIDIENKIVRTGDKIQIVFYANDTQGDLQQWNLVLNQTGEIIKVQERSF